MTKTHIAPSTRFGSPGRIYVRHAFQKKSKIGIKTPEKTIGIFKARLERAEALHTDWLNQRRWTGENG